MIKLFEWIALGLFIVIAFSLLSNAVAKLNIDNFDEEDDDDFDEEDDDFDEEDEE